MGGESTARSAGLGGLLGLRFLYGLGRRGGHQLLFALLDGRQVGANDPLGIAVPLHPPPLEPHRVVAQVFDQAERVCHQQHGLAATPELGELVQALVREALVADRQHLVDEEHIGLDVNRHREPQAHIHAGRVRLDGGVDEFPELREVDDVVEAIVNLTLRQAQHDPVDEDVLAPGDFGMESGAELDQRGNPPVNPHAARRRLRDACHQLERRALPRAVPSDDRERRAFGHAERTRR